MDDFIRRLFGFRHGSRSRPNEFDEHANVPDRDFFESSGESLDAMFEHFQQDMFVQMESLHSLMEDMFRGYGAMDFPSADFSFPSIMPNDQDKGGSGHNIFTWSGPSPFFRRGNELPQKTPRDYMLKEDQEIISPKEKVPVIKRGPSLSPPKLDKIGPTKIEDTDLDGKISDENVLALIQGPEEKTRDANVQSPKSRPGKFFSSQSVHISTFNGPDGKMEHKKVVRDSSGREESTVTRSIGNKSYSVTTVTDNAGVQEKHENLQNMDEGELSKFEELWSKPLYKKPSTSPGDYMLSPKSPAGNSVDPQDLGLFYKLFGGRKN